MNTNLKTLTKRILTGLILLVLSLSTFIPAAPAAAQTLAPLASVMQPIQGTDGPGAGDDEAGDADAGDANTDDLDTDSQTACDQAQFVADVTVPDGTRFLPGARFTKTWRLKNTGTCDWTRDYELVFDSGDRLGGAYQIELGRSVLPGKTVDITVVLVAPKDPGEYTGYWLLRNEEGEEFGLGKNHDKAFWVSILVAKPSRLYRDLAKEYCQATWTTGHTDELACPDPSEDTETGFINRYARPMLESGRHENEPALITFPSAGEAGLIQGIFPAYLVKDGDHFRTVIGCLEDSQGCKVTFQLSYRTRNGRVKTLGAWREKYDEKIQKIDIDLSELAGKQIELILTVYSRDDNANDQAFWLRPAIWR